MPYSLSSISIYPIKSIHGVELAQSQVEWFGLTGDRRYMLINSNGEFITGREFPQLVLIKAERLTNKTWELSHPDTAIKLVLDPATLSSTYQDVVIWEKSLKAQHCSELANAWFSQVLNSDVRLVYFGEQSERFTKRRPESPVGFADGYPFHLTSQTSLEELNRTCQENIQMAQFRPNLVVTGSQPFEEETWKRLRIGDVEFENVKPCARCIFTTVHPETALRSKKGEPMKTLGKFRLQPEEKAINFGINLIALNTGEIHVGDKMEVLEYQEAFTYQDKR
ncbi:MOSC domain-containing protein [Marinomonas spartinae]|uniref:MOSC domain-containing protein n=1 Tax=Marinomonas spartinae TaxID=1792290 RepID=UPI0018F19F82|nr:MOSC domain-containing protein [Marinomonas spartinae]MBJ7554664.1 MOSC domain-containing protein [Marinomonas spartinae]